MSPTSVNTSATEFSKQITTTTTTWKSASVLDLSFTQSCRNSTYKNFSNVVAQWRILFNLLAHFPPYKRFRWRLKRRVEFHDKAQDRVTTCFGCAQEVSVLGPTIHHHILLNQLKHLADLIQLLTTNYGTADIGDINGIAADMQLPLDLTGSTQDNLANMIIIKN